MSAFATRSVGGARAWLARWHQLIGWPGLAGVCLLMTALVIVTMAWSAQTAFLEGVALDGSLSSPLEAPVTPVRSVEPTTSAPGLSSIEEIPLILTQMEQAALTNGLAWRAADYRLAPATPAMPAMLEVRCNLKGSYPQLRRTLVLLLRSVPGLSIREFSITRPSGDTAEVDTKLQLVVYLLDDASRDAPVSAGKS